MDWPTIWSLTSPVGQVGAKQPRRPHSSVRVDGVFSLRWKTTNRPNSAVVRVLFDEHAQAVEHGDYGVFAVGLQR